MKAWLLVGLQFLCLGLIFFTGPGVARNPLLLAIEGAGLALGIWAIVAMRLFNFNITPTVKIDGYMVRRGPYTWIRHPMYSSLLLICGALVADSFTWLRLLFLLALTVDLLVKLRYEEQLLAAHYPAYATYMTTTKRLIPYVY